MEGELMGWLPLRVARVQNHGEPSEGYLRTIPSEEREA